MLLTVFIQHAKTALKLNRFFLCVYQICPGEISVKRISQVNFFFPQVSSPSVVGAVSCKKSF